MFQIIPSKTLSIMLHKELFKVYLMSAVKTLGLNRLLPDEYMEMMDENAAKVQDTGPVKRCNTTSHNQHMRMLEEGKTIKLHEILRVFKRIKTPDQMADAISLGTSFDPESKFQEFQEKIGRMYDNVIGEYISHECPDTIFNTDFDSTYRADFIEFATSTSKKGRDLRKLVQLYLEAIDTQINE